LGLGSPDPDFTGAVSPAWVHLKRSTVGMGVSAVFKEESTIFKSAEKALGHDEMQNIMKQFEDEQQRIKRALLPGTQSGGR